MARHTLLIKPQSAFQTPVQSDTLLGHICWAVRYVKGEKALIEFLGAFSEDNAPLILSSGFPRGYLPMPILRPLSIDEEDGLSQMCKSKLEFAKEMKSLKKISFIGIDAMQILKDNLSYFNLYNKHIKGDILLENPNLWRISEVWHNAKNRLSDRVIEGKLFAKQDIFFSENAEITVYLEDLYFGRDGLIEILDFIAKSGYGADKSSGRGFFEYSFSDDWDLPTSEYPNAFMSLSHYHPKGGDFIEGFYETTTKFGKIGGHWASGIEGGPFKMPLLMLTPGSVLIPDKQKNFYGGLIANVHKKEGIVHYGISLPLKVRVV
jgi:CRISPR-associated protein Csm4